jgi:trans-aconitate 2-methyltransferase
MDRGAFTMRWDPAQYGRFATDRGRPFVDLLDRVGAHSPRRVVDVGCGPGNMTQLLCRRWPDATIEGLDSSAEMIAAADAAAAAQPDLAGPVFRVEDASAWVPRRTLT